jgi:outer membrane protein, multidrug efflux system
VELDQGADIARRTLESRQSSFELVQRRFDGGVTSELDVERA